MISSLKRKRDAATSSNTSKPTADCVRVVTYDNKDPRKEVKFFFDRERLCKSCDFFKTALDGGWSEGQPQLDTSDRENVGEATTQTSSVQQDYSIPTITFPDDRPEIVKMALYFLETKYIHPAKGTVLEVCRFADKIGIRDIIKRCDQKLAEEAKSGDAVEYISFAEAHALPKTYRCSSVALINQSYGDTISNNLSAKTFKKLIDHRRVCRIVVAYLALDAVSERLYERGAGAGALTLADENLMLTLLSIVLTAEVHSIAELSSLLVNNVSTKSAEAAVSWLAVNDGFDLKFELAVPKWATVTAIDALHRHVLASHYFSVDTPLIQKLRLLVCRIYEKFVTLDPN